MPARRASAAISSWRWRPSTVPASAKPLAPMIAVRTPFSAHAFIAATVSRAGPPSMAMSIASGSSAMVRRHMSPSISPPPGLIGKMRPPNPALIRFAMTACPIFPGVREAPMTATWRGSNKARSAASASSAAPVAASFDAEGFTPVLHACIALCHPLVEPEIPHLIGRRIVKPFETWTVGRGIGRVGTAARDHIAAVAAGHPVEIKRRRVRVFRRRADAACRRKAGNAFAWEDHTQRRAGLHLQRDRLGNRSDRDSDFGACEIGRHWRDGRIDARRERRELLGEVGIDLVAQERIESQHAAAG